MKGDVKMSNKIPDLILTEEERELILNKRMNNLNANIKKGSWSINLSSLDKDSFMLTTRDEYNDTSTAHTLDNQDAHIIFNFLKDRYSISRQINQIEGDC